ncbi:MAG: hypothetical protein JXD22_13790 [Sedimentisphaerales bacterium]|nr:hypothetical protein [Sedimentisphaerales bacterium]
MCLNNVRQVGMACIMYSVENDDRFPLNPDQLGSITPCWWRNGGGNDLMADLSPYVQNVTVFVDPSIPHAKLPDPYSPDTGYYWPWYYLVGTWSYGDMEVLVPKYATKAGVAMFSDHCMNLTDPMWGKQWGMVRTNHTTTNAKGKVMYPDDWPEIGAGAYGLSYQCWSIDCVLHDSPGLNTVFNDGSARLVPPEELFMIKESGGSPWLDYFPPMKGVEVSKYPPICTCGW